MMSDAGPPGAAGARGSAGEPPPAAAVDASAGRATPAAAVSAAPAAAGVAAAAAEPPPGPDWRGRFAAPLGAPSWVHPYPADNLYRNVEYLSRSVDRVQLLLFGKDYVDEMLAPADLERLAALRAERGLAFSLHLPGDYRLLDCRGAELEAVLDQLADIRRRAAPLAPDRGILHVDSARALDADDCARATARVLAALARRFPDAPDFFLVENTRHDLLPCRSALAEGGFGLCADFGHLYHAGLDIGAFLSGLGGLAREAHLAGFGPGGDHLPLAELEAAAAGVLYSWLPTFRGPITLEIFNASALWPSVELLARILEVSPPCPFHSSSPPSQA